MQYHNIYTTNTSPLHQYTYWLQVAVHTKYPLIKLNHSSNPQSATFINTQKITLLLVYLPGQECSSVRLLIRFIFMVSSSFVYLLVIIICPTIFTQPPTHLSMFLQIQLFGFARILLRRQYYQPLKKFNKKNHLIKILIINAQ